MQTEINDLIELVEWGLMTIDNKLTFGLNDLQGALARETRVGSILDDVLDYLKTRSEND